MTRAFGLIAIIIAMYIGMSIYTDGIDRTLNGIFSAIEPVDDREDPLATHLTPAAGLADAPSGPSRPRGRVTERVRDRVTADLQQAARRRGYETD
jgi:hypothetical protein